MEHPQMGVLGSSQERFIVDSSSPFKVISGRGTPTLPLFTFPTLAPRAYAPNVGRTGFSRKFTSSIVHSAGPTRHDSLCTKQGASRCVVHKTRMIPLGRDVLLPLLYSAFHSCCVSVR